MSAETGAQIAAVDAGLARKSKVRSTRAKAAVLPFKPTLACDYRALTKFSLIWREGGEKGSFAVRFLS